MTTKREKQARMTMAQREFRRRAALSGASCPSTPEPEPLDPEAWLWCLHCQRVFQAKNLRTVEPEKLHEFNVRLAERWGGSESDLEYRYFGPEELRPLVERQAQAMREQEAREVCGAGDDFDCNGAGLGSDIFPWDGWASGDPELRALCPKTTAELRRGLVIRHR